MTRVQRLLMILLIGSLSACSWSPKLKFWESSPDVEPGRVKVNELRRSLVCGTPGEAAVVRYFDSAQALSLWDQENMLQLGRLQLPLDADFVLVEQGRRNTGGYSLELDDRAEVDAKGVLTMSAEWLEPAKDRMLTQIVTSLCVLLAIEPAEYTRIVVNDVKGTLRASTDIERD